MAERKQRRLASDKNVNELPVEVIGHILSRVRCVRLVALACATCRKWKDAVRYHLYKVTCSFPTLEPAKWQKYEDGITKVLKQTTNLREISVINGQIHVSNFEQWLQHTTHTLKSFTLLSRTRKNVNILEKLAIINNGIEHLEWGYANDIPTRHLRSSRLPFLVSLTLNGGTSGLKNVEDIQLLFSYFPNLKSFSLISIVFKRAPSTVVINLSSSLKSLNMKWVSFDHGDAPNPIDTTLVLHADNLSFLSLMGLSVMSVEVQHVKILQHLIVQDFDIVRLRFGGTLQRLVIWNAPIRRLEMESLRSLIDLTLFKKRDSQAMWLIYKEIKQKVSARLRKLRLLGGLPTFAVEDLDTIAFTFPELCSLSLYHQDTLFGQSQRKLPVFGQLIYVELFVSNSVIDYELFGGWIIKLLQCCPNLKCMSVKLEHRPSPPWREEMEFPLKLASYLNNRIRSYPYVKVRMSTRHPKELVKAFTYSDVQRCVDLDGDNVQSTEFCLQRFCIWLLVLQSIHKHEGL